MNNAQLLKIVEQYDKNNDISLADIKVVRISDQKTTFVEQLDDGGRTVMMSACEVAGATYWAGYSTRTQTVYISLAA